MIQTDFIASRMRSSKYDLKPKIVCHCQNISFICRPLVCFSICKSYSHFGCQSEQVRYELAEFLCQACLDNPYSIFVRIWLMGHRNNKSRLTRIMNAKKARAEEDEKTDQQFFKDYNPLDTAFAGVISSKEKENVDKHWGPGRFGKNPIHPRQWLEIMSAPSTEEEAEFIRRQDSLANSYEFHGKKEDCSV